jgi:hypothetical protein
LQSTKASLAGRYKRDREALHHREILRKFLYL